MVLLKVLGILLAGFALFALFMVLEKSLKRPGLAHVLASIGLVVGAVLGFTTGQRLLPALFIAQAVGFLYHARWQRSLAGKVT